MKLNYCPHSFKPRNICFASEVKKERTCMTASRNILGKKENGTEEH